MVLALRVYSIFERSMRVGLVLAVFLVIEIGWMTYTSTQLVALQLPEYVRKIIDFQGCIAIGGAGLATSISSAFWAAPLLFDGMILGLTLYKIVTTQRHAGGKIPILQRILKSSILYYLPIAATHLVSTAMAALTRATLKSFNPPASLALTGILATRLVLSLFDTSNVNPSSPGKPIVFPFSFRSRSKRRLSVANGHEPRDFRSLDGHSDVVDPGSNFELGGIARSPGGGRCSTASKESETTPDDSRPPAREGLPPSPRLNTHAVSVVIGTRIPIPPQVYPPANV
ncbi:uncharacterized protein JCM15063_004775 [Sporobolomyces koalae]|uniref:uncharacterized protein n=1 Tax=Sporobolomyces koalae TaxID=500713 RepID=UPI00317C09EF